MSHYFQSSGLRSVRETSMERIMPQLNLKKLSDSKFQSYLQSPRETPLYLNTEESAYCNNLEMNQPFERKTTSKTAMSQQIMVHSNRIYEPTQNILDVPDRFKGHSLLKQAETPLEPTLPFNHKYLELRSRSIEPHIDLPLTIRELSNKQRQDLIIQRQRKYLKKKPKDKQTKSVVKETGLSLEGINQKSRNVINMIEKLSVETDRARHNATKNTTHSEPDLSYIFNNKRMSVQPLLPTRMSMEFRFQNQRLHKIKLAAQKDFFKEYQMRVAISDRMKKDQPKPQPAFLRPTIEIQSQQSTHKQPAALQTPRCSSDRFETPTHSYFRDYMQKLNTIKRNEGKPIAKGDEESHPYSSFEALNLDNKQTTDLRNMALREELKWKNVAKYKSRKQNPHLNLSKQQINKDFQIKTEPSPDKWQGQPYVVHRNEPDGRLEVLKHRLFRQGSNYIRDVNMISNQEKSAQESSIRYKQHAEYENKKYELLKEKGLSILYKVGGLHKHQMSKEQTEQAISDYHSGLVTEMKGHQSTVDDDICIFDLTGDSMQLPKAQTPEPDLQYVNSNSCVEKQDFNSNYSLAGKQINQNYSSHKDVQKKGIKGKPVLSYLKSCQVEHVSPRKAPFQKDELEEQKDEPWDNIIKYEMPSVSMGSPRQSKTIGVGLRNIPVLGHGGYDSMLVLSLSQNNLTDESFEVLLDHLPKQILKELKVSENPRLTASSYSKLGRALNQQTSGDSFNCIERLTLESNQASDFYVEALCKEGLALNSTLKQLNLSKNQISNIGMKALSLAIGEHPAIQSLLLHWNQIGGRGLIFLLKSLRLSRNTLLELDLSFNHISTGDPMTSKQLTKVFGKPLSKPPPPLQTMQIPRQSIPSTQTPSSKVKIIKRSEIEAKPSAQLASEEIEHSKSIYKLGKFLAINKCLQHLDIRHNGLSKWEIEYIGDCLKTNHTLLGIHIGEGNGGTFGKAVVDVLGNVHYKTKTEIDHSKPKDNDLKMFDRIEIKNGNNLSNPDNCWICGDWKQIQFSHMEQNELRKAQEVSKEVPTYVNIRIQDSNGQEVTQFEEERLAMMEETSLKNKMLAQRGIKHQKVRKYELYRIVPVIPGKMVEEESITPKNHSDDRSNQDSSFVSYENRKVVDCREQLVANIQFWLTDKNGNLLTSQQPSLCFSDIQEVKLINTNYFDSKAKFYYFERMAVPRQKPNTPKTVKIRPVWSFEKSIFKSYAKDTQELMDACFDFDWRCSRLQKLLEPLGLQERNKVYEMLREFYPKIKQTYKHFSSLAPAGGIVPCLGSNVLTTILFNCPALIDGQNLNLSRVDLQIVGTNATRCQIKDLHVIRQLNPDKFLIRFQFLQLLVLLTKERYRVSFNPPSLKGKQVSGPSASEAIEWMITNHLSPAFRQYDVNDFREGKLWNQYLEKAFLYNFGLLKDVYHRYSGKLTDPGQTTKLMSCIEFVELITKLGVVSDVQEGKNQSKPNPDAATTQISANSNLYSRDLPNIFNISMMTRIDELSESKHTMMTFVEFLEAIARIADNCNFQPIIDDQNAKRMEMKVRSSEAPVSKRRHLSQRMRTYFIMKEQQKALQHKVLILCQIMARESLGEEYKQKFERQRPLAKDLRMMNEESSKEASDDEAMMSDESSD